jgi:hypothetical protein
MLVVGGEKKRREKEERKGHNGSGTNGRQEKVGRVTSHAVGMED